MWSWLTKRSASPQEEALGSWWLLSLATLFLIPLAIFVARWAIGAAMTAGSGGGRIGVGYALYFAIITWSPFAFAIAALRRRKSMMQLLAGVVASLFFALLSFASVTKLIEEISHR